MLTYSRYKLTRFWAVYEDETLLCVTVYRKGARAVIDRVERGTPEERVERSERPESRGSISSTSNRW